MYTGARNLTSRCRRPSLRSQRIAFHPWHADSRYRPQLDQLSEAMFLLWPRSFLATPMVSMSQITTVPSPRPDAR